MKRIVSIALAAALACAAPLSLAACGQDGGSAAPAATDFATIGDVIAAEPESTAATLDEERYVCAFLLDGTWWRVEAALPDGMYEAINDAWMGDQAELNELLSPLEVTSSEVMNAPSEDDLAALVGKTGAELAAEGFTFMPYGLVVNGSETDCTATLGSFDYLITFDGAVPDENTEDPAAAVADMTVTYAGLQGPSWDALLG